MRLLLISIIITSGSLVSCKQIDQRSGKVDASDREAYAADSVAYYSALRSIDSIQNKIDTLQSKLSQFTIPADKSLSELCSEVIRLGRDAQTGYSKPLIYTRSLKSKKQTLVGLVTWNGDLIPLSGLELDTLASNKGSEYKLYSLIADSISFSISNDTLVLKADNVRVQMARIDSLESDKKNYKAQVEFLREKWLGRLK